MSSRGRRGSELATVAGVFVAYGAVFLDRLAPLFIVSLVAADLGAPASQHGTVALAVGLGWAISVGVARMLAGRLGDRTRLVLGAVVAAAAGALSTTVGDWWWFLVLRAVGGVAAGTTAPPVTALTFAVAPSRRRGLDLGIVQASTRVLGSLVGPVVVTAVAVAVDWRAALLTSAALLVVSILVLVACVPPAPPAGSRLVVPYRLTDDGRRALVVCAVASAVLLAWLSIFSQSALPFVAAWLEVDLATAGRIAGTFGVGAALGALVVPVLSDRVGRRAALAGSAVVGSAAGIVAGASAWVGGAPPTPVAALLLVLAGGAMGGLPLVISIIPAEAVASGDVGRALAVPIVAAELFGGALLPVGAAVMAADAGLPLVVGATAAALGLVAVGAEFLRPPVVAE